METTQLSSIDLSKLYHAEAGQFITRFFEDFDKSTIDTTADPDFKRLFDALKAQLPTYNKALDQVKAQQETDTIATLDTERDNAVQALKYAVRSHQTTKVDAEKQAYAALQLILNQYKGVESDAYEQETVRLNNLYALLTTAENTTFSQILGVEKFITRLNEANQAFNDVFANRSYKTSVTQVYNVKALRTALLANYTTIANYVESNVGVKESTTFYKDVLAILNNSRKYFSDTIAKREGKSAKPTPPPTTTQQLS